MQGSNLSEPSLCHTNREMLVRSVYARCSTCKATYHAPVQEETKKTTGGGAGGGGGGGCTACGNKSSVANVYPAVGLAPFLASQRAWRAFGNMPMGSTKTNGGAFDEVEKDSIESLRAVLLCSDSDDDDDKDYLGSDPSNGCFGRGETLLVAYCQDDEGRKKVVPHIGPPTLSTVCSLLRQAWNDGEEMK